MKDDNQSAHRMNAQDRHYLVHRFIDLRCTHVTPDDVFDLVADLEIEDVYWGDCVSIAREVCEKLGVMAVPNET